MVDISRRDFIAQSVLTASAAALASSPAFTLAAPAAAPLPQRVVKNGRINQSVCLWSAKIPMNKLVPLAAAIGLRGIDFADPTKRSECALLKQHGLIGTMTMANTIPKGFNRRENHANCIAALRKSLEATAAAGWPNVICFSGNVHDEKKQAITPEEGLKNCAEGIKQIIKEFEEKKVTLCIELLNSHDHKDYMCDNTKWGVELCKAVGSDRFKLLFDIYHMGVMGEDIVAMIKEHHQYIGHYHTAGVPGRHEIDDKQKLKYPEIMKAIAATDFHDYVAHEFTPTRDPVKSLIQAVEICDV